MKRIYVLAVVALFSVMTAMAISGSGTQRSPYVISTITDLNTFGSKMGGSTAYWKLGANISYDEVWTYGNNSTAFQGHFDGNGKTISGLTLSTKSNNSYCAFIGNMSNAEVSNLTLSDVTLTDGIARNPMYCGILAGYVKSSTISKCKVVSSTITINVNLSSGGTGAFGGVVGYADGESKIQNSSSESVTISCGAISHTTQSLLVGGIVGYASSAAYMSNCAAKGFVADFSMMTSSTWRGNAGAFAIGGVAGVLDAPTKMSENLYATLKVNAPYAAVGPVVGVFKNTVDTKFLTDYYSGENISSDEMEKTSTWKYGSYELKINQAIQEKPSTWRNYSKVLSDGYLSVDNTTFAKTNSISDNARNSKTVLWYTGIAEYDPNNTEKHTATVQVVYPTTSNWNEEYRWSDAMPYYSYYMQGVNAGSKVATTQFDKLFNNIATAVVSTSKITVVDNDATLRGVTPHTLQASIAPAANVTYTWYNAEGTTIGTGATCEVAPSFTSTTTVSVEASDGTIKNFTLGKALLDTRDHTSVNAGKETNPYVISSEAELRLWSEYSHKDGTVIDGYTASQFNGAWFELGANITMSSAEFQPIGFIDNEHKGSDYTFHGHFDGKGYIIKGLNISQWKTMGGGQWFSYGYGLFGVVGGASSKTVIKNVIIDSATLQHDPANTDFCYDWQTNSLGVGTLAGLVLSNTTIKNIDVASANINDNGSSNYQVAWAWHPSNLWIGGVIGHVQHSFADFRNGDVTGVSLSYLSANADVTIEHATYNEGSRDDQTLASNGGRYNHIYVGGIVGGMGIAGSASSLPSLNNTYYSGQVKCDKAIISPVVAFVEANNIGDGDPAAATLSAHYDAASYKSSNNYYNKYKVYDGTSYVEMTDAVPANSCGNGSRTIAAHTDGSFAWNNTMYEFQGVNRGAYNTSSSVISTFAEGNESGSDYDAAWGWESTTGRVALNSGNSAFLKITVGELTEGKYPVTATLGSVDNSSAYHYQWFINSNEEDATQKTAGNGNTSVSIAQTIHSQYVYCKVTVDGETYTAATKVLPSSLGTIGAKVECTPVGTEGNYSSAIFAVTLVDTKGTETITTDDVDLTSEQVASLKSPDYNVTYTWYNAADMTTPISGATTSTYTANASGGTYFCDVLVKDLTAPSAYQTILKVRLSKSFGPKAIYICPTNTYTVGGVTSSPTTDADDENPGTADAPVLTWRKAYELLNAGDTWENNTIVLMGESPVSATMTGFASLTPNLSDTYNRSVTLEEYKTALSDPRNKNATITGKWNGADYGAKISLPNSDGSAAGESRGIIGLWGDTRFQNLTFYGPFDGNNDKKPCFTIVACQYHNLEMGEGLVVTNFSNASESSYSSGDLDVGPLPGSRTPDFQIFGGFNNDNRFYSDPKAMESYLPKDGFTMTFKSGRFGTICTGGRQSMDRSLSATNAEQNLTGIMGTPNVPVKCKIVVDIDQRLNAQNTVVNSSSSGNLIADYDVAAILAGNHEGAMYGDVDIVLRSGKVSRVINGILGALRVITHTVDGQNITYPYDSYFGRANILIDPANSEYRGNDGLTDNTRTLVTELYGGGLGRHWGLYAENEQVMTTFYGKSNIVINGGTFGVSSAYDSYADTYKTQINPGIYGSGAGGMNGIGDDADLHTNDAKLPYWNTNSTGNPVYGDWSAYTAATGARKLYVKCLNEDGTYTNIDPMETSSSITINGGVFKSELNGIFGGGNGFVNERLIDPKYKTPNPLAGSLFGKTGAVATSITVNDGQFYCDVYGGSRGNRYYYDYTGTMYDGHTTFSQANYKANAQVLGNTELNINGGIFYKDIFAGGYGAVTSSADASFPEMAKVKGNTFLNVNENVATFYGNIYGGGENAKVNGNTTVHLSAGQVAGEIFGGGKGAVNTTDYALNTYADVTGNTNVFVEGINVLWNAKYDAESNTVKNWNGTISGTNASMFVDTTSGTPVWLQNHNIYGGGDLACNVGGTAKVTVTRGAVPKDLIDLSVWKNSYEDDANPHFYVFGGGYGAFTKVQTTNVTVGVKGYYTAEEDNTVEEQWSMRDMETEQAASLSNGGGQMGIYRNKYGIGGYTVLGVIGGGYAGLVGGDTNVELGGLTFTHRVYGGGYGQLQSYNDLPAIADLLGTGKSRENLGEVGGNTHVTITAELNKEGHEGGVYGDVFGGGAGVESSQSGDVFTDYVHMGEVLGTTSVIIAENAKVYGNVYGGGDVANVASTSATASSVVVRGGDVFGDVFGGGKGRLSNKAADYTLLGKVAGDTNVNIEDCQQTSTGSIDDEQSNAWGDVYGGGEIGNVAGSTHVTVNGGNIGNNIFGAGLGDATTNSSSDVAGSTNVTVNGGSFLWRVTADKNGYKKQLKETADLQTAAKDIFDFDNNIFYNDHNIYGGGNDKSTVTGSSNIIVNHGMMSEALEYAEDYTGSSAEVLSNVAQLYKKVSTNHSHPQFSVLGGGYGEQTVIGGNANVTVQVGHNADEYTYAKQYEDRAVWDSYNARYAGTFSSLSATIKDAYYGGDYGENGLNRYKASRLANTLSIPNHSMMYVVGGGMAGTVTGNTNVTLTDQTMCQGVFGGGIGAYPTSTPTYTKQYGKVEGNAVVNISGAVVAGDVFGGGAGVPAWTIDGTNHDFSAMAPVAKTTNVTVTGGPTDVLIFGRVFGGGDIANVLNSETADVATSVTVGGGSIYQQVFGGGAGRLSAECGDYTTVGKVVGNTKVTINEGTNAPWLWNRLYGGGYYGTVTGNTDVVINGGHIGYNIFGGGYGDVAEDGTITSANVNGNTNITVNGGEWILSQMWDAENRNWVATTTSGYSSQYDAETKSFLINHNIYGGGNKASVVGTYGAEGAVTAGTGVAKITMNKGLLKGSTSVGRSYADGAFFSQEEWVETYKKTGSFHFCVIGGGYGEQTKVGSTDVNINMSGSATLAASDSEKSEGVLKDDLSDIFKSEQSILDVIGGGYYGEVAGDTHVKVLGDSYLRRAFGGSFYADVQNTNIDILSANIDDVFGGGMMGDVKKTVNLNVGKSGESNNKIFINDNVYGGNDVSGEIDGKITANVYGGKIYNNVYGAGNGNYLYALNQDITKVRAVEDYESEGVIYPLVYEVPKRKVIMPASAETSSEASRLVNINSYRPLSQYISLNLLGAASSPVTVYGKVFGGGNTASVTMLDNNDPKVTVNIGDYVTASEVYMGADGEAMFDESAEGFLNAFKQINSIALSDGINWSNDPYNRAIPQTYLPLSLDERVKTFPHIIDLYFQPVEMPVQPTLKWNGNVAGNVQNTTIGSFFCGGNRGNMDVTPDGDGNVLNYLFPTGLTIKDKIVGGCNNANFTRNDLNVVHEGGYLLGSRATAEPMIHLDVKCKFAPQTVDGKLTGGNIYGGCYKSGTINGDISTHVESNIVGTITDEQLETSNSAGVALCNVYGAGFGTDSYVYGNVEVVLGDKESVSVLADDPEPTVTPSANFIYGGGEQGNVIGNTTVQILNGTVKESVTGGSYAGYQYGSTHVLVGYPEYYTVNNSGTYTTTRADKWNNYSVIKREIKLLQGDIISPAVYESIVAGNASLSSSFTHVQPSIPAAADWEVTIGDAVYGGGYSLASGFTGAGVAGTTTVLKYTEKYNVDNTMSTSDPQYNKPTTGFGGNTTVLVGDAVNSDNITISGAGDGGFFGDGHLSYAEGFRSGELKGYGYATHAVGGTDSAAPKKLNTIQRLDVMRLTDNCVELDGARDYTINEISTAPYSLARIGELQMVSSINGANALPATATNAGYRNYLGMLNNIHYVGAVTSNVAFTDEYHNASGALTPPTGEGYGTTYRSVKQKYINNYYSSEKTVEDQNAFKQRNDATAKNMIGVSSGYALKIQNVQTDKAENPLYYGPVVGVIEMKLINVETGEGGGYVYADNIHENNPEDFLETSGNFVFPNGTASGQYVVDDCLMTAYDDLKNHGITPSSLRSLAMENATTTDVVREVGKLTDASEIHYWFLNGNKYTYNLHITGYTYNGKLMTFDADTSDGLTVLEGATDNLAVSSIEWDSHEGYTAEGASCDISNESKEYKLKMSASALSKLYAETGKYVADVPRATPADGAAMPAFTGTVETTDGALSNGLYLAMQLTDNVNNNDKEYYNKHLSEPCEGVITLTSGEGENMKTYVINLTISYVKSPGYTGNIAVSNCALPGEYIKLSKESLKIEADESFAQNGEYWRIGKRTEDEVNEGHWSFVNDEEDNPTYYTIDIAGESTSEMFKDDIYVDPNGHYIMIPAYYFMNGYGVQYVYTCNNINDAEGNPLPLEVDMTDETQLTVHNYHQMVPRATLKTPELHIAEAAQRANAEDGFAAPRVYIKDATDLKGMATYVNETEGGADVDFIIQNDIEVSDYTAPKAAFMGSLHGDGHAISGISGNLFGTNSGKVYNLGMLSGNIAAEGEGKTYCSYTYGNLTAYDMAGDAKEYTENDFRYGRVAYNLNQYYLDKRYVLGGSAAESAAGDYVEKYYRNGDYRYAYDNTVGTEYLRTNVNPHYAVDVSSDYDGYTTYHDTDHAIDKSRFSSQTGTMVTYAPLFNAAYISDTYNTLTDTKNDYIFFGQELQPEASYEMPHAIASHSISEMTNRVWRVSGFNRSKVDAGYHFNALQAKNVKTWVMEPTVTAVDFTCQRDGATLSYTQNWTNGEAQNIFYAPAKDAPDSYYSYDVAEGVTRNLLTYTDNSAADYSIAQLAKESIAYEAVADEADIKSHQVVVTGDDDMRAVLLHLVDKEDFNAPIAFVAGRAWYDRNPETETGYVEKRGASWESVCLPFTVDKAVLSYGIERHQDAYDNGATGLQNEITFFYGDPTEEMLANPKTNDKTLNHEFWLRGLNDYSNGTAYFHRPETAIGAAEGTQGFKAYTPYIVSFPGAQFYEFDMTDQTVSFKSADDASIAVTDDATTSTTKNGYSYTGAFLHSQDASTYAIELNTDNANAKGDRFTANAMVYPFRAALSAEAISQGSSMRLSDYVMIGDVMEGEDDIVVEEAQQGDPAEGVVSASGLRIYAQGKRIVVVSDFATTVPVYTLGGQLVRVLDVVAGKSTFSGFGEGIYIADQKKLRLK